MSRRTKIVCTLGPAVGADDRLDALIRAGMNVARINCSHGDWETRHRWIDAVRRLSPEVSPVGVLIDLQGPKFRLGMLPDERRQIPSESTLTIGPTGELPLTQPSILAAMEPGARVLLGDGEVEIEIRAQEGENFEARVIHGGLVKSRQGLTVVGKVFHEACLTPQDRADIEEAVKAGADYIALSYVHTAQDMNILREIVQQLDPAIRLIAKIETRDAVNNIDSIVAASDGVMVARGDMGLQMNLEEVPIAQKQIIAAARKAGKPVITATQMLESMITNSRPTRAESTDVANAILDGTDAVMLSGETATGQFPIEAVEYMSRIAAVAEDHFDNVRWLNESVPSEHEETTAVAYAVAHLAHLLSPNAIITTTTSGQTARLVSKFRPREPIFCATWNQRTYRQLSLVWGVDSVLMGLPSTTDEQIHNAIQSFLRRGRLEIGDNVIVSAGVPAGMPGNTNLIMLQKVEQG